MSQLLPPLLGMNFNGVESSEKNTSRFMRKILPEGVTSQPGPTIPKKQPVENSALTGSQRRWEKRWPPAGLRCWNSFCRRNPYGGKPRMRSSAGRHMKTKPHFGVSICSETKPILLCSDYYNWGGAVFLTADNLPPDPKGEVESPLKEKRVKKTVR